jgi:tetratricopeptide (TPR) repeat protein
MEQPLPALPYLQRAVELNEEDTEARFQYGLCLAQQESLNEAIRQFQIVVEQDPNHADAYYNLGVGYAFKEDAKKAMDMLDQALSIQPDHDMAANLKQLMQTL